MDDQASGMFTAAATTWPAAGRETIRLRSEASRGTTTPLWARAEAGGPESLQVDLLAHDRAVAAGFSGLLLGLAGQGGEPGTVRVGVDYGRFAQAYGGNFAGRMRLVQLPACALSTPQDAACRQGLPLTSTNDRKAQTISAPLQLSTAAVALALTSDPGSEGGEGGSYAATDLKPSGSWSAGGSEGSFSYNYPITVPSAASSLVPKLSLGYSSGSVDGEQSSTAAQASWLGDGWTTPNSYIEQSFIPCTDDPEGSAAPVKINDACYAGRILTLSLNGSTTALVWDQGKSVWRPQREDGSLVSHVTNANNGTGTYNTDYWTVTTREGTVFQFGRNQLPGWTGTGSSTATNSVAWEPVYSAHAPDATHSDPCYNAVFSLAVCNMAYRWNLDYVKDTHGNAMAYYYKQDTNNYRSYNNTKNVAYIRDTHLDHIDYGFTDGNAYGTVPDRITFNTDSRCVSGTCTPLDATTKANWPDVPYDLVCNTGVTCVGAAAGFFSTVRLTSIVTQQKPSPTASFQPVDTYTLTQTIPPTGDGLSPTLWLQSIAHTGHDTTAGGSSTAITTPAVAFAGTKLANRTDARNLPAYYRYRIGNVTTESGSVISPTYTLVEPCAVPIVVTAASNTSSCYPVSWTPPGYTAPITDWFNKYAVTKVTQTDPTGGAPALSTSYVYGGGAAWHYDDNEVVKAKYRTYGQFRGYGDVLTLTGDGANDRQAASRTTYYRGMSHNNGGAAVNLADSQGGQHEDVDRLQGQPLEETAYLGKDGPVDHSTITSYWVSPATATRTRTGLSALTASWVSVAEVWKRQAVTGSGAATWRVSETDTTYDANTASATFAEPLRAYGHTVPVNAAYDTCTTTKYVTPNTAANLVAFVAETETDSVACGGFTQGSPSSVPAAFNALTAPASVNRPAQVISATRTFYDDPAFATTFPQTTAPSKGDATMRLSAVDYSGGAFTYIPTARQQYDSIGRSTASLDANGYTSTTAFTANTVGLTNSVTATNPLGQTVSTTFDTMRGLPLTATDINGVVTTHQYDALGRVTGQWGASRPTTAPANQIFTYDVSNTGTTAVTTKSLNDSLGYSTSTVIFDGALRQRQTQRTTPQGGRLVSDVFYDSRGWASATYNGWWDPDTTPNATLVSAANLHDAVPNQDFLTYDGLGRVVQDASAKNGVTVSTTTTVNNGDRTTVIPPSGGLITTTQFDPLGRKTETDQYSAAPTLHTPADMFTGVWSVTGGTTVAMRYGYDGHGDRSTVTDPLGAVWTTTNDLLSRPIQTVDPDSGTMTLQYDAAGNLVQTTDALQNVLSYTYDKVDRKTGEYAATVANQSTTNRRASWVYDNSDNALPGMKYPLGHVTTATAYDGTNAYVRQARGFNVFGHSVGENVTIPATGTDTNGLARIYIFQHAYSVNTGLPFRDVFPVGGGLPAETVNYGYSGVLDLPDTLNGLGAYAQGTTYDAFGRLNQATLGGAPNTAYVTDTYDTHSGRLTDRLVTRSTATPADVDDEAYEYDLSGNLTRQTSTRLGAISPAETQCFQYDTLARLTSAWTATDACAATPTPASHAMVGDSLGAASAYWTSWTFDAMGNWDKQVQHAIGAGSDTTTSYTYNGNGAGQPHTLTGASSTGGTTSTASYHFDAAGHTVGRNAGLGNQTLTWDRDGRLASVSGSTAGNTSYVYDADGQLLLQKDPGKTTLYLDGEQLVLDTAAQTVTGTRYYTLPGGSAVAVRTGTANNAYQFQLSDPHGTPTLYLDATGQVPSWRQSTPYGGTRGAAVALPDNHAFLNKPASTATGLTALGARYYDPLIGRFISVDPKFTQDDAQQANGYVYGSDNPATHADPTGESWWKTALVVAAVVVVVAVVVVAVVVAPEAVIAVAGYAVETGAIEGLAVEAEVAGGTAAAAGGGGAATTWGAATAATGTAAGAAAGYQEEFLQGDAAAAKANAAKAAAAEEGEGAAGGKSAGNSTSGMPRGGSEDPNYEGQLHDYPNQTDLQYNVAVKRDQLPNMSRGKPGYLRTSNGSQFEWQDDAGNYHLSDVHFSEGQGGVNSTHGEELCWQELEAKGVRPNQVTRIYTEREPCGGCNNKFSKGNFKNAKVTYSTKLGAEADDFYNPMNLTTAHPLDYVPGAHGNVQYNL
ncbi:RHS repeat-associated core domain-containing protein [Dactylosporangium matsuzakiense]|uniref:RHS repeat-associated core domain-containing protein n=1 Tax=Dactylosporangium matsuzakiense TaxID=53360 RepID=UPI0021C444F7|nr:RHS repeat-associated core domain-containing protein [Dactylosporangium matsuzakiense]UWZ43911.1 sugar-binding protein [Dactylosporangium matsuzakiense]